jgi:hypothetical protein
MASEVVQLEYFIHKYLKWNQTDFFNNHLGMYGSLAIGFLTSDQSLSILDMQIQSLLPYTYIEITERYNTEEFLSVLRALVF